MSINANKSFQIHNYSFAAIQAFILKVKEHPIIYKDHAEANNSDSHWSQIVRSLLENGIDCVLNPSERLYWERIYRGLWMWMRHILTMHMVGRYFGQVGLSQNPKYIWLEYLEFLEPFIQLSPNSYNYDTDLDPYIYLQVLSAEQTALVPYSQCMVYWKLFQETLGADTFYISICVQTMDYLPYEDLKLEFEIFLELINQINDDALHDDVKATNSVDIDSEEVTNFIEGQLMSLIEDNQYYDHFLSLYASCFEESDS